VKADETRANQQIAPGGSGALDPDPGAAETGATTCAGPITVSDFPIHLHLSVAAWAAVLGALKPQLPSALRGESAGDR
jgi:hypothetical protein